MIRLARELSGSSPDNGGIGEIPPFRGGYEVGSGVRRTSPLPPLKEGGKSQSLKEGGKSSGGVTPPGATRLPPLRGGQVVGAPFRPRNTVETPARDWSAVLGNRSPLRGTPPLPPLKEGDKGQGLKEGGNASGSGVGGSQSSNKPSTEMLSQAIEAAARRSRPSAAERVEIAQKKVDELEGRVKEARGSSNTWAESRGLGFTGNLENELINARAELRDAQAEQDRIKLMFDTRNSIAESEKQAKAMETPESRGYSGTDVFDVLMPSDKVVPVNDWLNPFGFDPSNGWTTARNQATASENSRQYERIFQMTEEERNTVSYLYDTFGRDKAYEYFDLLTPVLEKRAIEHAVQFSQEYGQEHPFLGALFATVLGGTVLNPLGMNGDAAAGVIAQAMSGETNPYDMRFIWGYAQSGLRSGVSGAANEAGGPVGGFLAGVGMSVLQNLANLPGGQFSTLLNMGLSAGTQDALEKIRNGESARTAFFSGASKGFIEVLTEKIGLDNLFDNVLMGALEEGGKEAVKRTLKETLKAIGVQAATEALEEGIAEIAGAVSDALIIGDYSGTSAKEIFLAMLGGFISGAFLGGTAAGVNEFFNRSYLGASAPAQLPARSEVPLVGPGGVFYSEQDIGANVSGMSANALRSQGTQTAETAQTPSLPPLKEGGKPQGGGQVEGAAQAEHQRVVNEYNNAVDPGLREFIINNSGNNWASYDLGQVNPRQIEYLRSATNRDYSGYNISLSGGTVSHIEARHGTNGAADRSMSDINELSRIKYVLDNFDTISLSGKSRQYKNADGTSSDTVIISKKVDGYYHVIEAVPESKKQTLRIVSAYKSKSSTGRLGVDSSTNDARLLPKSADTAIDSTVPQTESNVNRQNAQNFEENNYANQRGVRESVPGSGAGTAGAGTPPVGYADTPLREGGESAGASAGAGTAGGEYSGAAAANRPGATGRNQGGDTNQGGAGSAENSAFRRENGQYVYRRARGVGGLNRDANYQKARSKGLTYEQGRQLDLLGRILGKEVVFSDELASGEEAAYDNGRIILSTNVKDPVLVAVLHEGVHDVEENAPNEFRELARIVQESMTESGNYELSWLSRYELYNRSEPEKFAGMGRGAAMNYVSGEVVAQGLGQLMYERGFLERVRVEGGSVLDRLAEFVRSIIERIGDAMRSSRGLGGANLTQFQQNEFRELQAKGEELEAMFAEALEVSAGRRGSPLDVGAPPVGYADTPLGEGGEAEGAAQGGGQEEGAASRGRRYSFAGTRAHSMNYNALQEAIFAEKEGYDPETIRQETGWFRGMDDEWRFEIAENLSVKPEVWDRLVDNNALTVKLPELIEAPELFEAYPELENVNVSADVLSESGITRGEMSRIGGEYYIALKNTMAPGGASQYLIHEIQHVIQSYEGFSGGTNPETYGNGVWVEPSADALAAANAELDEMESSADNEVRSLMRRYRSAFLEERTALRNEYSDEVLNRISDAADAAYDALKAEIGTEEVTRYWNALAAASPTFESPTGIYMNTAGEIEARDAANRRGMTAEERRKTPPDVRRSGVFFAEGGGAAFSINPDFYQQFDQWDKRSMNGYFVLGKPSKALLEAGIPDNRILMDKSKIVSVMNEHNLSADTIRQLPEMIENPVMIMKSLTDTNSWVVYGELYDADGEPVLAAIHSGVRGRGSDLEIVNKIASAYSRSNTQSLINRSEIIYTDKNRITEWLQWLGLQLPSRELKRDSVDGTTVPQTSANVNRQNAQKSENSKKSFRKSVSSDEEGATLEELYETERARRDRVQRQTAFWESQLLDGDAVKGRAWESSEAAAVEIAAATATTMKPETIRAELENLKRKYPFGAFAMRRVLGRRNSAINNVDILYRNGTPHIEFTEEAETDRDRKLFDFEHLLLDAGKFARRLIEKSPAFEAKEFENAVRFVSKLKATKVYIPVGQWDEVAGAFGTRRTELASKLKDIVDGVSTRSEGAISYTDLARQFEGMVPEGLMTIQDPVEQFSALVDWRNYVVQSFVEPNGSEYRASIDAVTNLIMGELFEPGGKASDGYRQTQRDDSRYLSEELRKLKRRRERELRQFQKLAEAVNESRQREKTYKRERADREALLKVMRRLERIKKAGKASKELIKDLIDDIDTAAISMTKRNVQNLLEQQAMFEELKKEDEHFKIDPKIEKNLERLYKRHIAEFDIEDVRALLETLRNLEAELHGRNRLLAKENARDLAVAAAATVRAVQDSKGLDPKGLDSFKRLFMTSELSPQTMADMVTGHREDNPLSDAVKAITNGQIKARKFEMDAFKKFDRWSNDKEFSKGFTGKDARKIKVEGAKDAEGNDVFLSPAMLTGLWLQTRSKQNMDHIEDGGVAIPAWKYYANGDMETAFARGIHRFPMSARYINNLAMDNLTAEEKAFGEAVSRFMNNESKAAINEVSNIMLGFEKAEVENYYPIMTDNLWRRQNENNFAFDWTEDGAPMTIEYINPANKGMLKERVPGSKNAVKLLDITDVLKRHARDVGSYYGLAVPYRDYARLIGYVNPKADISVAETLSRKYGPKVYQYFVNFQKDIAKPRKGSMGKLQGNTITTALAANVGVVLKQASGYTLSAAELGWKPVLGAVGKLGPVNRTVIDKYTPILWERMQGYSTNLFENTPGLTQQAPWLMGWLQKGDTAFVAKIWKAAELWVQQNEKALNPGSDKYYQRVAERFEAAVLATQTTGYTATKAGALRSPNPLMGVFTLFQGQGKTQLNLIVSSWSEMQVRAEEYKYDPTPERLEKLKAAQRRFSNSCGAVLFSGLQFGLLSVLGKLLLGRDDELRDEDGKLSVGAAAKTAAGEMLGSTLGMVSFGSEVGDLFSAVFLNKKWYDIELMGLSGINDTVNSLLRLQGAFDSEKYTGQKIWNAAIAFAESVLGLFGVPAANVHKIIDAVRAHGYTAMYGEQEGRRLRLISDATADSSVKLQIYRAYKAAGYSEGDEYLELVAAAEDRGIEKNDIKAFVLGKLKEEPEIVKKYEAQLEKLGVYDTGDKDEDGNAVFAIRSKLWDSLDEDMRKNAVNEAKALAWYDAIGRKSAVWVRTQKDGSVALLESLKWVGEAKDLMSALKIGKTADYIALRKLYGSSALKSKGAARAVQEGLDIALYLRLNKAASDYGKTHGETESLTQDELWEFLESQNLSDFVIEAFWTAKYGS
jgi:hypothetical protein